MAIKQREMWHVLIVFASCCVATNITNEVTTTMSYTETGSERTGYDEVTNSTEATQGLINTTISNNCSSAPCFNQGFCISSDIAPFYNCSCTPEYTNQQCQELRFVELGDCKYHINFQNKSALSTANTTCRNLGGSLAMIKTEAIQSFLENSSSALYGMSKNVSFWIGGYKRNGQWMWEDLTAIENGTGFTKWSVNSPNNRGDGLIISSRRNASALMSLHWIDETDTSEEGFVCEIAKRSTCSTEQCNNRGKCIEVGCQTYCSCHDGYGGGDCRQDLLVVRVLSSTAFTVDAGANVTVLLNISSVDGPVRIEITDHASRSNIPDISNAFGTVEANLGQIWYNGETTRFYFRAYYEGSRSYNRTASVNIVVRNPYVPTHISAVVCGTEADVFYTPDVKSLGFEHRVEIVGYPSYSEYPSSAIARKRTFGGLSENSDYLAKVTVCPSRCIRPLSTTISGSIKNKLPDHIFKYFLITKPYDADVCRLVWSVEDFPITEYKLTIRSREIAQSNFVDHDTEHITLHAKRTDYSRIMKSGLNYTFTISARTCNGFSTEFDSIGECVMAGSSDGPSVTGTAEQSNGAVVALALLFTMSVLVILTLIFLYWWREHRKQADATTDKTSGSMSRNNTKVKPYSTTSFDNGEKAIDSVDPQAYTDYEITNQYIVRADKTTNKSKSVTACDDDKTRNDVTKLKSVSDGYEIAIPRSDKGYEDVSGAHAQESAYQYENFSAAPDHEEHPEWSDDSFSDHNSDDYINVEVVDTSQQSVLPSLSALNVLKSKLKHRVTRKSRPDHISDATGDPKNTVGQSSGISVALKPPTVAQAQSSSAPASGDRMVTNTSSKPQLPTKIALKPVVASQNERNKTEYDRKITGVALKLPTASKPILTAKPDPVQKKTLKPRIAGAARQNGQADNELAAVLSRLKPVVTKK